MARCRSFPTGLVEGKVTVFGDDAPRLSRRAADHAGMIGTAMIGTAIASK
jgi:hypothetical protein